MSNQAQASIALSDIEKKLHDILSSVESSIRQLDDLRALDELRTCYIGKKGALTDILKLLGSLSADERPKVGQQVNQTKQQLFTLFNDKEAQLKQARLAQQLAQEAIDMSLPGRGQTVGSLHPITHVRERVEAIFSAMGFMVVEGPEIEDDYHNFTALNIPENHPARAMADTFYFGDGRLLRTHTSPVQIRGMKVHQPPIKMITPGRVYRKDSDQTHTPMFNQLEGLVVAQKCTFTELKACLQDFLNTFFEKELTYRFRPSYFPFTEPSAEVDIAKDDGTGWLEVLGCGMVHPNVLNNVGIDSEKYTGFAFGIGLDRLAMLHYKINDLRMFFENDLRFLEQF